MVDEPVRVVIERILPATPDEVFEAWTSAEILRAFLCPGDLTVPDIEVDARVGGRFRVVMRDGTGEYEHHGEYRALEPGRRIVFTWVSKATGGRDTLVTIDLTPHEDGTRLVLVHEALPDADAGRRHHQGWTGIVEKLDRRLRPTRR